jgi:hypothetical protein
VEHNEYDLWKVRDTVREKMRTPAPSSQEEEHMTEEQGKEEEQAEFTADRKDSGPDAMEMESG